MELFHFKGFDPVEAVRSKARQSYERLLDAAPSDARIFAQLEKASGRYRCTLEIRSLAWPISLSITHWDPCVAITRVENAALRRLERWKSLRYCLLNGNARELADVSA